ncbi:polysaccharide biosynthesis tyrosine autokinase [Pseudonocardia lutea]|uniref:non-specific protein-tyrosine kinase n=1 Tax=Pseudonocardia lutea TaxID=2172015 RepID=A0ABW1I2I3_9PSEU
MTVQDYLRVLRERWLVVVVAVVLGLVAAGAVFFVRPVEYTARLTMYVSAQTGDNPQQAYQGAQLSQQRVTSYVELVTSPRVTSTVVQRLGLADTPDQLAKKITASSALDSVLIDVNVTDPSPARAAEIANSIGTVMTELVTELERPAAPNGVPPVQIRVVQPSTPPTTPSSTGLSTTLALGLLAGLAVGVAAALARNALDTSVKSPEQLREAAGVPSLGAVVYDPEVPKRPLTVHDDPMSPRAEAYRQLRTNLQFVDIDNPRRVLTVTSSLPGEGKTTTTANLAIALSATGQRVLLVEADLRKPKVSSLFGLDGSIGLTSVLTGQVPLNHAIQNWAGRFDILGSGSLPPNPSELLGSQQMQKLIEDMRNHYDVVLLDTPPLLPVTDAAALAPATDGVILVVRFNKTTRQQVGTAAETLNGIGVPLLGSVMSMAPSSGPRAYSYYGAYYSNGSVPRTPTDDHPHRPQPPASPRAVAQPGARRVRPDLRQ